MSEKGRFISRAGLVLLVLLSGLAMLPFTGFSAEQLNWQLYAGIYEPDLYVNHDKGFPGSAFLFVGVDYPPLALATIYVDGNPIGVINIDASGHGIFLIQSQSTDPLGRYYITLATDANTSATEDIRLEDDEPLWPPPPGYDGPVFFLDSPVLTPTPTNTPGPTSTPTVVPPTPTATTIPPGADHQIYLPMTVKD